MTREEAVRRIERAAEEKLRVLDLSGLELEEVPPEIAKCTHLVGLDLGNNQLTSLPDTIRSLSNLTSLDL